MDEARAERRARRERQARLAWNVAAVVGLLAGLQTLWLHLTMDPLADIRAYYDAATRLNEGLQLYPPGADTNAPDFYRYPPLFAMLFRPLALLPFPLAAAVWQAIVISSFVLTLVRLGVRRRETWIAVCVLASPIAWTLAVGQAHSLVTLLLALGSPAAIAFAGHIKLFPILAGLWYVGRRDWHGVGWLVAWTAGLALVQLVLEPQATLDFLRAIGTGWVGEVRSISPFAVSPLLWAVLVGAGALASLRWAGTRWGWPIAVALATLSPPRLLSYMLMSLLAALREPDRPQAGR
ncbi:MAG: glycosyltransferase 87 family protein [Chloroflexi bacterium]|jgi:hypothetical protein|nr:glycosyltransferase 87 family protein [Chloroflexota bacterium]